MSSIEKMLAKWRGEGVPLNAGAAAAELESLERFLAVPLPADLRSFYSVANGMQDFRHDSRMVSMWSIERLIRERNVHEGEDEWGLFHDVAFADVIFSAWHLRYRVRRDGHVTIIAELTHEELPSLYALFDAFLERPNSLGLAQSAARK